MINNAIHSALVSILKAKRQKMKPAARRFRAKPARWLYPKTTENRYKKAISAWFRPMRDYVHKYIKEHSEAILHGDSDDTVLRNDATTGKSFNLMVRSLDAWVGKYFGDLELDGLGNSFNRTESPIYTGLRDIATTVFNFNDAQYKNSTKAGLGIDFPVNEDWWPGARDQWAYNNYWYMQKYARDWVRKVDELTERAVTSGWSLSSLTREIMATDSTMLENKARFLARDQIGKLNGQITQHRMESAGLSMYIWSTSGDERVRGDPGGFFPDADPSHYVMDNKLCRWDDPTVYSEDGGKTWIDRPHGAVKLHPGEDYNCRCTAMAYWNELVDEVDEEIEGVEDNDLPVTSKPESTVIKQTTNNELLSKPVTIEQQLDIKRGQPIPIDEAYQGANPNYGKGEKWEINCPNCVNAFELRCRGYDVKAMPWSEWRFGYEIYNNPIVYGDKRFFADGTKLNQKTLTKQLTELPEGSRCAIIIKRQDRKIGHTFVSVTRNGKVEFYDPQSGEKRGSIYNKKGARGYMAFYRTDNLELNDNFVFSSVVKGNGVK